MSRDPLIIGGGKAIHHAAAITLDMRKKSISDKTDPYSKEEAVKIGVTVKKNHVITDRFPYVKVEYFALFGEGIDCYLEVLDVAIEAGVLIKSGAFIKYPDADGNPLVLEDGTKLQWQGNARFIAYCKENPEFFEQIINESSGDIKLEEATGEELEDAKNLDKTLDDLEDDPLEESRK